MLGVSDVLAPPELQLLSDEGFDGEPLAWTESLGSGGPLFFADLLRTQASTLEVTLFGVLFLFCVLFCAFLNSMTGEMDAK